MVLEAVITIYFQLKLKAKCFQLFLKRTFSFTHPHVATNLYDLFFYGKRQPFSSFPQNKVSQIFE